MKLHSPGVERGLRRAVRRVIRASPALRREARRNRRSRQFQAGPSILRVFGCVILAALLFAFGLGNGRRGLDAQLALITLWLTAATFGFPQAVLDRLFGSPDNVPLAHLPISKKDLFGWQWQKAFRWCAWILAESLVFYGIIGVTQAPSTALWLVVPVIALLQTGMLLALGNLLLWRVPLGTCQFVSLATYGALFPGLLLFNKFGRPYFEWVLSNAGVLNLVLPAGWIAQVYRQVLAPDGWANLLLLAPLACLLWLGVGAWRQLKSLFVETPPMEFDFPTTVSGMTEEAAAELATALGEKPAARSGPTAIEDNTRNRAFLEVPDWQSLPWLDRLFARFCTQREWMLCQFLGAPGSQTGQVLAISGFFLLAGLALTAYATTGRDLVMWGTAMCSCC